MVVRIKFWIRNILGFIHMVVRIKVWIRNILGSYTWLSGLRLGLEIY